MRARHMAMSLLSALSVTLCTQRRDRYVALLTHNAAIPYLVAFGSGCHRVRPARHRSHRRNLFLRCSITFAVAVKLTLRAPVTRYGAVR